MCIRCKGLDLDLYVAVLHEHERRVLARHDLEAVGVAHRVCHGGRVQKEYCGDSEDCPFYGILFTISRFILDGSCYAPQSRLRRNPHKITN